MRATQHTLARREALLTHLPRAPFLKTAADLQKALATRGPDFTTTVRTVERDLEALSLTHPIEVDRRSRPHGWRWMKDGRQPFAKALTPAQAVALLMARAHLASLLPETLRHELEPLFHGAGDVLEDSGFRDWHRRTAIVPATFQPMAPDIDPEVMATLHQAMAAGRCVVARYRMKGRAKPTRLLVHPLGLLVRGPVTYLVCTLYDGLDPRQLALHRFESVRVDAGACRMPDGFDFPRYASEAWHFFARGAIELVADFDGPAGQHLFETPVAAGQTLQVLENGDVRLTATLEDCEQLRWWLMGFGSQVRVCAPAELRSFLADELRLAADAYEEGERKDEI